METNSELLRRIFDLWDRAVGGQLSKEELNRYLKLMKMISLAASADEASSRADLNRTRAMAQLEGMTCLPPGTRNAVKALPQ